jgi:hypothetical protein
MVGAKAAVIFTLILSLGLAAAAQAQGPAAPVLLKAQQAVQYELSRLDAGLEKAAAAAARHGLTSAQTREALIALGAANSSVIDCAAISPRGRMELVVPAAYQAKQGQDVSAQPIFVKTAATGQPQLGEVFQPVEGMRVAVAQRPVLSAEGKLLGVVSAAFNPCRLARQVLERFPGGEGMSFFLIQRNGLVIYHRSEADQGRNLLEDRPYAGQPQVKELVRQMDETPQGSWGPYPFQGLASPAPSTLLSHWVTVGLHGLDWRLGYSEPAS